MNIDNSLMKDLISAVGKLRGSHLKVGKRNETLIESIQKKTSLSTLEETMALVGIFENQCSGQLTSLECLADFYQCSTTECMILYPALDSLRSKGFTTSQNSRIVNPKTQFRLREDVFREIIGGIEQINPTQTQESLHPNEFEFCYNVIELISAREHSCINTKELFSMFENMEKKSDDIKMVRELKEQIPQVSARVLFYAICNVFITEDGDATELSSLLKDIYDDVLERTKVLKSLKNDSHPLTKAKLVRMIYDPNEYGPRQKQGIQLSEKGLTALFGDEASVFIAQKYCSSKYEFINRVKEELGISHRSNRSRRCLCQIYSQVEDIEESNTHLPFVANMMKFQLENQERLLFYCVCMAALDCHQFGLQNLSHIFSSSEDMYVRRQLKGNLHPLQLRGLVELTSDTFMNNACLELTDKGKELFFEEDLDLFESKKNDDSLLDSSKIAKKNLFFDEKLQKQLSTLGCSLKEENLVALRERLQENNLPTGIAVLLYGHPGTGKTESVMQLARETGRAVMHVNISETKSMWFGESEKIIKDVFTRYRKLSEKSKLKPILLFNEADAVFSKRKDSNSGNLAQTENAIQNIILEEMENLDGILIATTNLASNLDSAFERRFLFKIRFDAPTVESKKFIWMDKLPSLSEQQAYLLASTYNFSGGEIDNITRKVILENVISGNLPNIERIITLCGEEKIASKTRKIGF